jgi:Z1 domain
MVYLDCCKLFTTKDSFEKFDQCTWTIEELEEEFRKLSEDKKKPKDYAVKVLTHPGALQITRPAILKNTEIVKWSYADQVVQTTKFNLVEQDISTAWDAFKDFYAENATDFESKNGFLILKASHEKLIQLLQLPNSFRLDLKPFQAFLQLANDLGKLTNWTIAIRTRGDKYSPKLSKDETGFKEDIELTKRKGPEPGRLRDILINEKIFSGSGKSANIITTGRDFSVTLTDAQRNQVELEFDLKREASGLPKTTYPEYIYRKAISESEGVLIVYLIDLNQVFHDDDLKKMALQDGITLTNPLIGYAIGVPALTENVGGDYLVNKHILENIKNSSDIDIEDNEEETAAYDEELQGMELE